MAFLSPRRFLKDPPYRGSHLLHSFRFIQRGISGSLTRPLVRSRQITSHSNIIKLISRSFALTFVPWRYAQSQIHRSMLISGSDAWAWWRWSHAPFRSNACILGRVSGIYPLCDPNECQCVPWSDSSCVWSNIVFCVRSAPPQFYDFDLQRNKRGYNFKEKTLANI